MYLTPEVLTTKRVHDPFERVRMLHDGDIQAAVLRGRKMRSDAFWNLFAGLGRAIGRAYRGLAEYRRTRKAIEALRQMDPHTLADIGLTPADIEYAATHGRYHEPASSTPEPTATPTARPANDGNSASPREAA